MRVYMYLYVYMYIHMHIHKHTFTYVDNKWRTFFCERTPPRSVLKCAETAL